MRGQRPRRAATCIKCPPPPPARHSAQARAHHVHEGPDGACRDERGNEELEAVDHLDEGEQAQSLHSDSGREGEGLGWVRPEGMGMHARPLQQSEGT